MWSHSGASIISVPLGEFKAGAISWSSGGAFALQSVTGESFCVAFPGRGDAEA
jgi:hypothetical protein